MASTRSICRLAQQKSAQAEQVQCEMTFIQDACWHGLETLEAHRVAHIVLHLGTAA